MRLSFICRLLLLSALVLPQFTCLASGSEIVPPVTEETVLPTTMPVLVDRVEPQYPARARHAGITGSVLIRALIDRDGLVAMAEVAVGSGEADLDEAALVAARRCRYLPARLGSEPVVVWVSYRIEFKLDDCLPHGYSQSGTPELIHQPMPIYPEAAKRAGLEGEVQLRILVAADGNVTKVEIARSSCRDCGFAEAALDAARRYRFRPYTPSGDAKGVWVAQTVRFRLE